MHNLIHLVSDGPTDLHLAGGAAAIVQPYRRFIEGWQLRATYLAEQLALHPRGADAHDLAELRLAELKREIAVNRDYLVAETSRVPPDDLAEAMVDELDELLSSLGGLAS